MIIIRIHILISHCSWGVKNLFKYLSCRKFGILAFDKENTSFLSNSVCFCPVAAAKSTFLIRNLVNISLKKITKKPFPALRKLFVLFVFFDEFTESLLEAIILVGHKLRAYKK